jgi:hypothetical protein
VHGPFLHQFVSRDEAARDGRTLGEGDERGIIVEFRLAMFLPAP